MRESRTLGSVRAKAEWLSYSTIPRNFVFFFSAYHAYSQPSSAIRFYGASW